MIEIDSDGIEWNGVIGIIVLKADEGTPAGEALVRVFRDQIVKKKMLEFAVTVPEQSGRRERREASGTLKNFYMNDGKITVLFIVDRPVTIKNETPCCE